MNEEHASNDHLEEDNPKAATQALRPLIEPQELQPLLLILDLDETLIHATTSQKETPHDFKVEQYKVYRRPGLEGFLRHCALHFELAVWSSASDHYVAAVVKEIFPPEIKLAFVWGVSRCTPRTMHQLDEYGAYTGRDFGHYQYTKPLKKVKNKGYDLARVLIVDDTPLKVRNAYGNAIYISEFTGDRNDTELSALATYLLRFRNMENVRRLEKRNWRERLAQ